MTTSHSDTAIHFADLDLKLQNPKSQALSICSHLLKKGIKAYLRKGKQYWEIWREAVESDYSGDNYFGKDGKTVNKKCNAPETVLWKPCRITAGFIPLHTNNAVKNAVVSPKVGRL